MEQFQITHEVLVPKQPNSTLQHSHADYINGCKSRWQLNEKAVLFEEVSKFVFQLRLETLAKNIYGKKAKFLIRGKKV